MTLDPKVLLDWLGFALTIGVGIYAFFVNRHKDVDQRFSEGSKRMDRMDARITKSEQQIEAMPGKDDVHALQMTLEQVRGDMKGMTATMMAMAESINRTENIVTRHEDHLREKH